MNLFPYSQIYLTKANRDFAGLQKSPKNSYFVIVGMPYDSTTTFRPGTRFAPTSIRDASVNIETNSILSGIFLEDVDFFDAGDLDLIGMDVREALRRITSLSQEAYENKKILISIGGEHTITYAITRGLKFDSIFIFDAHLDLRDEYPLSVKYGHATVTRRICEDITPPNITIIGARAYSKEELEFAKKKEINVIDISKIKEDFQECINLIRKIVKESTRIYISIDMDAIDPSIAQGVSNPEPFGLSLFEFFKLLTPLLNKKVVGLDLVEVCPLYDNGSTSVLAAKILLESMATIWANRLSQS